MTNDAVIAFMERYFRRLSSIDSADKQIMATMDQLYAESVEGKNRAQAAMNEHIAKKKQVNREFWSRSDEYWEPCSLSDFTDHDWERVNVLDVKSNGLDCFAFRYRYDKGIGVPCEYITLLKLVRDELKIVDHLF